MNLNLAREQAEILRAGVVLAAADGVITASEKGLLKSLAKRIGLSEESLDKMIASAMADDSLRASLFHTAAADPMLTLELLVAAARIDGEIHDNEQQIIAQLAERLDVPVSEFEAVYDRGIARADAIRGKRS